MDNGNCNLSNKLVLFILNFNMKVEHQLLIKKNLLLKFIDKMNIYRKCML